MASSLGSIFVDLLVGTSKFDSGLRNATRSIQGASASWNKALKSTATDTVVQSFQRLAAVAGTAFSVQKVIEYSDSYRNLESRLSLVTDSSAELIRVQKELFAIAQQNSQPLEDTIDAYTRLQNSLTDTQKSQTDLIKFTDLLSKTLVISGTNAAGAATFLQQFGQAASSDFKAVGQELQTFADQNPRFYQILRDEADKYGKSLKDMAKDGELSFHFVSDAVMNASESIESDAAKMSGTVGKSFTKLNNSLLSFIGNSSDVQTASGAIASGIDIMAQAIDRASDNGLGLTSTMYGLDAAFIQFYENAVRGYATFFEKFGFDTSEYKKKADDLQTYIDGLGDRLLKIQDAQKAALDQKLGTGNKPAGLDKPDGKGDGKGGGKGSGSGSGQGNDALSAAKKAQQELDRLYGQNETYITGLTKETLQYNETMDELAKLVDKGRISQEQYYTALTNLDAEYDKSTEKANLWAFDVGAATKRAAENVQDSLADFLFDPFAKGLDGMLLGFVNVLRRMAAEAASATLLKSLFGGGAGEGLLGGLTGGLGNLLGGATAQANNGGFGPITWDAMPKFAEGGYLQPGQWGIAGEREAELIYGGRTGMTVIPPGKMGGSAGNTYNIDARGADQGAVRRIEQSLLALAGPGVIEQRVTNAQRRGEV